MSSRFLFSQIYSRLFKRESRILHRMLTSNLHHPLPSKTNNTTPKVMNRASIPVTAGVVKPKIDQADPTKLIARAELPPAAPPPSAETQRVSQVKPSLFTKINQLAKKLPEILKTRTAKIAAAAAAFGGITLTSKIANATPLLRLIEFVQQEISNFSWKGVVALSFLFMAAVAFNRLFFNPRYKARPGEIGPKRLVTKFALPALGAALMVGAGVYALGTLAPVLGLVLPISYSLVYPLLVIGTGTIAGALILKSWGKEIYNRASTVKISHFKYSKKNRFFNSVLTYSAQACEAVYMTYRATTLASITLGVVGKVIVFGALAPLSLLPDIAVGAAVGLLYYLGYYRGKAKFIDPSNRFATRPHRGVGSMSRLALLGGLCGFFAGAAGPHYLLNLLFASGVFIAEAHGFIHGWRWNTAGRNVEETRPLLQSDQDIRKAATDPSAQMVTIMKPAFAGNLPQVVPALLINILLRQGSNWEIHQINGQPPHAGTADVFTKMYSGLNRLGEINEVLYRAWIAEADQRLTAADAAGDTAQAIEVVADLYLRLYNAFVIPCADNNSSPPWHGNLARYGGFLGFSNKPLFHINEGPYAGAMGRRVYTLSDMNLRGPERSAVMLGAERALRELAQEYRRPAPRFTTLPILKPSHEEIMADLRWITDSLYRKHNVPIQMDPFMLFLNYYPQYDITKQEKIDRYNGFCKDVWTGVMVVRFDPKRQRFYTELIPTKVAKMLKTEHDAALWRQGDEPNYRKVRNVDSREREDNRQKWVNRPLHTIGETHSDIFCIDASAHFKKYKNDLNKYPTSHNQLFPALGKHEYVDVLYADGSRLRVYGDGRGKHLDKRGRRLTKRLDPSDNEETTLANGHKLRRYGDGTIQIIERLDNGEERVVRDLRDGIRWLPGTPKPSDDRLRHAHREAPDKIEDFTWIKNPAFKPKYYFYLRTPFQSMSDSEQIDFIVTDFLDIFEKDERMPHIYLQWKIKEKRKVPYDPDLKDSEHDKLLMPSPTYTWFLMQATEEESGKTRYYPYNIRKDWFGAVKLVEYKGRPDRGNENVNMPTWMAIDDRELAVLATPATDPNCPYKKALRVRIRYPKQEIEENGNVKNTEVDEPMYLPYPYFLDEPDQYYVKGKKGAREYGKVEFLLYREKVGQAPLIKFTFARQNQRGEIVMRNRERLTINGEPIERNTWETFVGFDPFTEEEYHQADPEVQAEAPYVDRNDVVHLPPGVAFMGKSTLSFLDYRQIKKWLVKETLYERFLPLETHLPWYDPTYIY